jgi:uncharacterized protein (UPF0335 family)
MTLSARMSATVKSRPTEVVQRWCKVEQQHLSLGRFAPLHHLHHPPIGVAGGGGAERPAGFHRPTEGKGNRMTRKPTHAIPAAGHNSGALDRDRLRSLVDRISALEDEKIGLAEDIRGLYAEAASNGIDKRALREIVRRRRQDPAELEARETLIAEYTTALQGVADLPLGRAAIERAGLAAPV